MPLKPGDRIERYVIAGTLGSGGMGDVYRAHDSRLQRSVALKILRVGASEAASGSGGGGDRMLREARAAAALEHPNVVAIYDVGQLEEPEDLRGTTYLAMELIKGVTLRAHVGHARVPMAERVRWLGGVARALAAAHAAGLVHRDIKPENVMIRDDGIVKVLDFGIAKRAEAPFDPGSPGGSAPAFVTTQGVIVGTPLYMAPEQMRGEAIDGRADQFSWGVMAYELLAGVLPWSTDGGAIAVVAQILSATPRPLTELPEVPPALAAAVTRALAKDREARFASMEALLAASSDSVSTLASTLAVAPVSPPPAAGRSEAPGPARAGEPARSRRVIAAFVVGALAVGVAGVAVLATRERAGVASAGDASAASTTTAAPKCTGHRECALRHVGEAYVCRASDKTCVPVASEDCRPMFEPEDLLADDTVWLGAMFPTTGETARIYGFMNVEGTNFARQEIAGATKSLEGAGGSQRVRRVALVVCDDSQDPMRAARHLVDDVGVPAVLGFGGAQKVHDIAGSLLIPRGVLTVSSLTPSPLITRLPQPAGLPRMVWTTMYTHEDLARATARMIAGALEPRLARSRKAATTRVTLARQESMSAVSFAQIFYRSLTFNGKSAVENGSDYQEIAIGPGGTPAPIDLARAAARVLEFAPSFLVLMGDHTQNAPLVEAVEAGWKPGTPRPTYIEPNGGSDEFAAFLGRNEERRRRFLSVVSASDSPALAHMVIRYNETHKPPVTRVTNASSSYDAFYLLAYGIYALHKEPITGAAIARAFEQFVPPGRRIDVGPSGVLETIAALNAGERIDLEGMSSGLDFDLATGIAPSDFALFCPAVDRDGRATGSDIESGVVYSAATGKVTGTMVCP